MGRNFISDLMVNLMPAILAGLIGGLGAYISVKSDIAVLLSNQTALIEQGKTVVTSINKHESELTLVRYQLDTVLEDVDNLEGMVAKK